MKIKTSPLMSVAMGIFLIVVAGFVTACREKTPNAWVEEDRVTSPDGQFDAVMTRESVGGVLGGVYWNVFIVRKGEAAPRDDKTTLLNAAVLRGEKLVWKKNHLLELHYDLAHIETFRNLWGSSELDHAGSTKDYLVEMRLAPSSPDFSFLTPEGGFQPWD
jgi:hypothetical protein